MTTAKPEGDRHHYVPQFYLRRFARNSQLKVHPLSGGAPSLRPARNTAMKYDFYSVPENLPNPDVIERGFSPIEGRADHLFRCVENGVWPLPRKDREDMARFIALQALRGPEIRDRMAGIVRAVGERVRKTFDDTGAAAWVAAHGGPNVEENAATQAWHEAATEVFDGPVGASFHAEQIDLLADRALPSLVARSWTVVRFDEPSLIGCDTPVCGVTPSDHLTPPAALLEADRIAYPLGRTTALILGRSRLEAKKSEIRALIEGKSDVTVPGSADHRAALNGWTAGNADEVFFHHPDDDHLVLDSYAARTRDQ